MLGYFNININEVMRIFQMLNNAELKTLQEIESKYYMQPMITKINADISIQRVGLQESFNHLYDCLVGLRK